MKQDRELTKEEQPAQQLWFDICEITTKLHEAVTDINKFINECSTVNENEYLISDVVDEIDFFFDYALTLVISGNNKIREIYYEVYEMGNEISF